MLANVPEHTVSLWTTYDIAPRWQVGGGPVYVSSRYANNANAIEVPGYVRGDLTAAFRPTRWLEVRLKQHAVRTGSWPPGGRSGRPPEPRGPCTPTTESAGGLTGSTAAAMLALAFREC
jgi:hypothetical protein